MSDWMHRLAEHYRCIRAAHPGDDLIVVFDIDGTILDVRHLVHRVLRDFDAVRGTRLFEGLRLEDIDAHENEIEDWLERRQVPPALREQVIAWYRLRCWSAEMVRTAHRPYRGVFDVIRWLQIQPRTHVGLNTGRPEPLREATLACLNTLGRAHRVTFADDLLHMNPEGWEMNVARHKVAGLRSLRASGYRVVAVIDNEPANLEAAVASEGSQEILFLHADTLYQSRRRALPHAVSGSSYGLESLITERDLPPQVEMVWHGVNDRSNLRQLLASPVRWAEVDVRRHPTGRLVLRHDPFDRRDAAAAWAGTELLDVAEVLDELRSAGKGVVVDLKQTDVLGDVVSLIERCGLAHADVWFNGRVEVLGEPDVRALRAAHPSATIQCPVDFIGPVLSARPAEARRRLQALTAWGVDRFSVAWDSPQSRALFDRLDDWGFELNLYAFPDLGEFLRGVLLLPSSITADFNFPEWHYFGRGSGHGGRYHRYRIDAVAPTIDVA